MKLKKKVLYDFYEIPVFQIDYRVPLSLMELRFPVWKKKTIGRSI